MTLLICWWDIPSKNVDLIFLMGYPICRHYVLWWDIPSKRKTLFFDGISHHKNNVYTIFLMGYPIKKIMIPERNTPLPYMILCSRCVSHNYRCACLLLFSVFCATGSNCCDCLLWLLASPSWTFADWLVPSLSTCSFIW